MWTQEKGDSRRYQTRHVPWILLHSELNWRSSLHKSVLPWFLAKKTGGLCDAADSRLRRVRNLPRFVSHLLVWYFQRSLSSTIDVLCDLNISQWRKKGSISHLPKDANIFCLADFQPLRLRALASICNCSCMPLRLQMHKWLENETPVCVYGTSWMMERISFQQIYTNLVALKQVSNCDHIWKRRQSSGGNRLKSESHWKTVDSQLPSSYWILMSPNSFPQQVQQVAPLDDRGILMRSETFTKNPQKTEGLKLWNCMVKIYSDSIIFNMFHHPALWSQY